MNDTRWCTSKPQVFTVNGIFLWLWTCIFNSFSSAKACRRRTEFSSVCLMRAFRSFSENNNNFIIRLTTTCCRLKREGWREDKSDFLNYYRKIWLVFLASFSLQSAATSCHCDTFVLLVSIFKEFEVAFLLRSKDPISLPLIFYDHQPKYYSVKLLKYLAKSCHRNSWTKIIKFIISKGLLTDDDS